MPDTALGFLIGLGVDGSDAKEALGEFEKLTGETFQRSSQAPKQMDTALLSNRESVRLLSEELGVHMPRAVSGALAEMLPAINAIGPALLGVFALAELPRFIQGIHDAADGMEGFGKEAKKAFADAIAASDKAIVQFKTIKEGIKLEAEVNRNIAALTVQHDVLQQTGEAWVHWAKAALAFASNDIAAMGAEVAMAHGLKLTAEDLAKLEAQRLEQLNTRTALEVEAHKKSTQAEEDRAKRVAAAESRLAKDRIQAGQEAGRVVKELAADQEKENKALYEYGQFTEKMARDEAAWLPLQQRTIDLARQEIQVFSTDTTTVKHLTAAYSEYLLVKQDAINVSRSFMAATREEVQAVNDDMLGSMKNLAEGAFALTGSQKAAAAFKVGYEIAEGIACLASGTWPPNPAAIVAAGLHFEAAAQFAISSGRGGRSHPSVGGGAGNYGSGRGGYGGGGDGSMPTMPQTLAPGAAGAGGRFSGTARVVVFGTDHELQNWVAGAVNGAVQRGVNVQATSSQRGATVGH